MINLLSKLFSTDTLRKSWPWILFLIGSGCYVYGYYKENPTLGEICIEVGNILIVGVVLGFVTNAAQFIGIFKSDLQDILYGKEFIKNRNDLQTVWANLSKHLIKDKFSAIHKQLFPAIQEYLPKEDASHYDNYNMHQTVEWKDKEKGIITVTDDVSFNLIAEKDKAISYPIATWSTVPENHKDGVTHNLTVYVDGKPVSTVKETKYENGNVCHLEVINLSGSESYEICYTREKTYSIYDDNYIGFKAKFITTNMMLDFTYPIDLGAIFVERGVQKDFKDIGSKAGKIKKNYKGVIFPKQGYIVVLNKK